MKYNIFPTPIWVEDIDSSKLELTTEEYKKSWLSGTLSSYLSNNNKMTQKGAKYLKEQIINCLQDFKIYDCKIINVWRNIYNNDFQERHTHPNSSFSFTIYEKLEKPQTVFFHPSHDMIYATKVDPYIDCIFFPQVKQNQIILFPSYLEHMVKKAKNSVTISGNIGI
tara:strand:+ start:3383 stop:3883 length:501 start_codon:yes stop_codon:yes gene_type:complete